MYNATNGNQFTAFDKNTFNPEDNKYTYIDVRTTSEVKQHPLFKNSINIPLPDLSGRIAEIPTDKLILVNCSSGFRSAAASSIIKSICQPHRCMIWVLLLRNYLGSEAKK